MSGLEILVIDDDRSFSTLARRILTLEGFDVAAASDGAEALRRLDGWVPALILLDVEMPVMDGRAFAAAYLGRGGPHAPIVLYTACAPEGARAVPAAVHVVPKSAPPWQLAAAVRQYAVP